jgi:hypothetical protein
MCNCISWIRKWRLYFLMLIRIQYHYRLHQICSWFWVIYGHVSGPSGLPAIGATVIAAEQQTGHTVNSIISIDGNYNSKCPQENITPSCFSGWKS